MKKTGAFAIGNLLFRLGLLALALMPAGVSAAPLLAEPFPISYGDGTLLGAGNTTTVWTVGNSGTSAGAVVTNTAALTYSGLTTGSGHGLEIAGTPGSARNKGATFAGQTYGANNPVVYASFLLQIVSAPAGNRLFAGLSTTTSGTTPSGVVGVWVDSSSRLSLSKNSATTMAATNTSALDANTHLVVLRYKWNANSSDDEVALWVDPGSLGAAEGNVPSPQIATTTGSDVASAQSFWIFHPSSSPVPATLHLDEMRVGTNWADVTPTGSIVAPPTGQPYVTQAFLGAGGLVLRGTNGTPGGPYHVLTAPNATTPMVQWAAIATNAFDNQGDFDCTNPVVPADVRRFYRLRLGQDTPPVVIAPSIVTQPTNQTVNAGQNVAFNVEAAGTAPLSYQWFFNTNTPLAAETNFTLTILNAQGTNAGGYSLRVTNSAGSVTSVLALLTVNTPPSITNQPQNQVVNVSNNATFTVGADGSPPLWYQWYFNTNTVLASQTNAALTIVSAQTSNAGVYQVVVTNNFGAITSVVRTLTVNTGSVPDFSLVGFASLSGFSSNSTLQAGGTTGGAGGPIVIASNLTWLVNYAQRSNTTLRVLITADIDCSSLNNNNSAPGYNTGRIDINNNKTIYSTNGATITRGTFRVTNKHNVIIQNLKFRDLWVLDPSGNYDTYGWDYIVVDNGGHHVWVDHCDFQKVYDGMVDVVNRSDYVTVSWCVFRDQKKTSLVGSSETDFTDRTHLNVTFHHNYYTNVDERIPRMRFGNAHVFNLFSQRLGGKGIQSSMEAATLIENCVFTSNNGGTPLVLQNGDDTTNGIAFVTNSTGITTSLNEPNFRFNNPFPQSPAPYVYSSVLTPLSSVANVVTNWAGVGKLTSF